MRLPAGRQAQGDKLFHAVLYCAQGDKIILNKMHTNTFVGLITAPPHPPHAIKLNTVKNESPTIKLSKIETTSCYAGGFILNLFRAKVQRVSSVGR